MRRPQGGAASIKPNAAEAERSGRGGGGGDLPPSTTQKIASYKIRREPLWIPNITAYITSAQIGISNEMEVTPFDDGQENLFFFGRPIGAFMNIDIAIANEKEKIAIEYNGPSHFLTGGGGGKIINVTRKLNGRTKAKRRFLEKLGWNVKMVDYKESRKFKDVGEHEIYIRGLID